MKKYLFLVGILLAGSSLQAAERLTFKSVLSSAVGSFWSLQTSTCAYPDVSGVEGLGASGQTVINFGPTAHGGSIHLYGGPMKIDTLLLEDGSQLNTGSNVPFLFAQPEGTDAGGKLSIFQNGSVTTNALLVNNLILPRNDSTYLQVTDTLKINWPELKVADITLSDLGDHFSVSSNSDISGESGAYFHILSKSNDPAGEDKPSQDGYKYYMYKD